MPFDDLNESIIVEFKEESSDDEDIDHAGDLHIHQKIRKQIMKRTVTMVFVGKQDLKKVICNVVFETKKCCNLVVFFPLFC